MKRLKKGFTLIELLVVIAIIGILATTLAPKLREQLAKAKDSKAIALLGAARTATQVIVVDKMISNTDNSDLTITLSDLEGKLDKKSGELLEDDANIAIGGSKTSAGANTVEYGGEVSLATSGTAISGDFTIANDDISLELIKIGDTEEFSTEGKAWLKY